MTEQNPNPNPDPQPTPPPTPTPPPVEYAAPGNPQGGIFSASPYAGPEPDSDGRTMGMLAHLLGIPLGFLGPLIIWLIKKDQSPFVDDQGKEALNFQLTVLIAAIIAGLTMCIAIGFVLLPLVAVADIIFCILGAVAANKGTAYRYPFNMRFIR